MSIDHKQLLLACSFAVITCILAIFTSDGYQFCTGACTGNLSNCWCGIIAPFALLSFYAWLPTLLGSVYYYLKAKPTFFVLLAVIIIIYIVASIALLIIPGIAFMISGLY
jgi:hypothetical protein